MKLGLEIRERHGFETHLNLQRETTGSRESTSKMISSGRFVISVFVAFEV